MKILKYLLMTLFVMAMFTGCPLDSNSSSNNADTNTEFFYDVRTALGQSEESEPLEVTDTIDDSTSFDSLL